MEEHILKMTDEADELRNKLMDAEKGRREAVRKMEAGQVEINLLQCQIAELQAEVKVSYMDAIYIYIYIYIEPSFIPWLFYVDLSKKNSRHDIGCHH